MAWLFLVLISPFGVATAVLVVGAAVFVFVLVHNPEHRLYRISGLLIGLGATSVVTPHFEAALAVASYGGFVLKTSPGGPWLLGLGVVLAVYDEYRRRRDTSPPAGTPPPAATMQAHGTRSTVAGHGAIIVGDRAQSVQVDAPASSRPLAHRAPLQAQGERSTAAGENVIIVGDGASNISISTGGAKHGASAIPPSAPEPPPGESAPPALGRLRQFLEQHLSADEIRKFVMDHAGWDASRALPGDASSVTTMALRAAESLWQRKAVTAALFDDLRRLLPRLEHEIGALQRSFPGHSQVPREGRNTPAAKRRTESLFSLLLDRKIQWKDFKDRLASPRGNHVFLVHGTYHQDLFLFLERVRRFHSDPEERKNHKPHEHISVPLLDGLTVPESASEWETRVRNALRVVTELPHDDTAEHLRTLGKPKAALVVLYGADGGGLSGAGEGALTRPKLGPLVEFLKTRLPALRKIRSKHPIRWLIPVEHGDYQDARPQDLVYERVHETLEDVIRADDLWVLEELVLPPWPEVRTSLVNFMNTQHEHVSEVVLTRCKATYDRLVVPGHTCGFAELAEALSADLSDT